MEKLFDNKKIRTYSGRAGSVKFLLGGIGTDLRAVCIVSQLHLAPLADAPADLAQADIAECGKLAVSVAKAVGEKCERCWIDSDELGSDPEHPTLCPRCAAVMKELA